MIIQPKIRGFICTNAHPDGCAVSVQKQIDYAEQHSITHKNKPKNVLIIGASTGYGLASRIVSAFGCNANTLGVFFEKPPSENKTASAGFYNSAALQKKAQNLGLYAESINCDAFANESKQLVIDKIRSFMSKVDLVVYSLASPRRTDPHSGQVYNSVLKPVGAPVTSKTLNTNTGEVHEITLETATETEIEQTIKVMGGEDWDLWLQALLNADVLNQGVKTVAYTYIGKSITWPIYGNATIGKAKEDLDRAAHSINSQLASINGEAHIAVLKGLVTQSSSAIPVMPLYIALLYKVMKEQGSHEGCIQQINHLFHQCLYSNQPIFDEQQRWRVDGKELDDKVQNAVLDLWNRVNTDNLNQISDYKGYQQDFLELFGFGHSSIDYNADVDPIVYL